MCRCGRRARRRRPAFPGRGRRPALDGGTGFAIALDTLERSLNIGGFTLVAVSFSSFGLLFWRAGERALAIIAIATGILTGSGQLPGLEPLFYLANAGFLTWYVALAVRFRPARPMPVTPGR